MTNVKFDQIAGNYQAKQSLQEIIEFLKNPERFRSIGARLPKGVLLYGPSGTGKTMIAKATACEAGVNFIQAAGSEFIEMYVGVGAKRVREIFNQARSSSPCILFIDEIECIGMKRVSSYERPNAEQLSTLDQLLNEMDGFLGSENVVVLAATNKYTMLDEALLRPGRFDRKIKIGLPDNKTRIEILQLNLAAKSHTIQPSLIHQIAQQTIGASGAELSNIINEACFAALRHQRETLNDDDITEAMVKFCLEKSDYKQEQRAELANFKGQI